MSISIKESSDRRRKVASIFAHLFVLMLLFVLPELIMNLTMPQRRGPGFYPGFYIKTLLFTSAFYVNYLYIIDKTLLSSHTKTKIVRFMLMNVAVLVVVYFLDYYTTHVWFPKPRRIHHHERVVEPSHMKEALWAFSFFLRDLMVLVLTVGLAVALRLSSAWSDLQRQGQELLAAQRATELDSLKSQLNPHFLFNTLNTIYALIAINPNTAQDAVHRLSGLLRYLIYEDGGRAELRREIDFVENYISLMRLRLGDKPLDININVGDAGVCMVGSHVLIPLVENAFKYGNTAQGYSPIRIDIHIEDNTLVCVTENSFVAKPNDEGSRRSSGVGLQNLRRRLSLLYGQRASLRTSVCGNIYKASISIPLES